MFRSLSPSYSLSNRLILLFLLGAAAAMVTLTTINIYLFSTTMLTVTRERIQAQSETSVDHIESYLAERLADSHVVASMPQVQQVLIQQTSKAQHEAQDFLNNMRYAFGYESVSILDEHGTVVLSSDTTLVGQNYGTRPDIQRALSGFPTISNANRDSQIEDMYFHVIRPILSEHGTIIGAVDMKNSIVFLDSLIGSNTGRSGEGSYSVLLDENLIRISVPAHPEMRLAPSVALSEETRQALIDEQRFGSNTASLLQQDAFLTGDNILASMRQLPQTSDQSILFQGVIGTTSETSESVLQRIEPTSWYYLHQVPEASFYAPVYQLATYSVAIMIITSLLAVVLIIWFAQRTLSLPLTRLVLATQAIAHGDLHQRVQFDRRDEIGKLATSFNAMADSLQARIAAEQAAQAEAMRLQAQEAESRQILEDTVAIYLAFVRQIAQGDLSHRVPVTQDGALGHLGHGLNGMAEKLRDIIQRIKQASANIATASAEILAATTLQASSAAQQSSAISQTSLTVEQIKAIAEQTAQQALSASQESQALLHVAQQGTHMIEETIDGMVGIRQRVDGIAHTILSLSEQTQTIGAITNTVSEIADQSNLLALNAAIEAARAGEQGKSFAVVAKYVRELAERSKTATEEVQQILDEIQRMTNMAVMVTEEGSKGVEEGVRLSNESGKVIHRLATEVQSGSVTNTQMAQAAHQQSMSIDQIGQAMLDIRQATAETLASTRQAESAARNLDRLAQSLQSMVESYRLQ